MSGYSLVMCACGMSALGIVLTKLISKSVEKLLILFYLGLATATTGTVGLLVFGQPSLAPATDWVLAFVIGLLGMVQQYVLVWAVQVTTVLKPLYFWATIKYFSARVPGTRHGSQTVPDSSCVWSPGKYKTYIRYCPLISFIYNCTYYKNVNRIIG